MVKSASGTPNRLKPGLMVLCLMLLTACGGNDGDSEAPSDSDSGSGTGTVLVEEALPMPVSNAAFRSTHFAGSAVCASCHNNLSDATAADVSIESDWSTSMMAQSARDPFYRAKVASEMQRNPQLKDVLDTKCSRCHAPMANVEAKFEGSAVALFGDGFLNPQNPYYDHAMDGVSCTSCHQIADDGNLGTLSGFSGGFSIVDLGISAERTTFGQYDNARANPMLNETDFRPTFVSHISDSEVCATCHNLKTQYVDADGSVVSTTPDTEFPEQMVYTELPGLPHARCQRCQDFQPTNESEPEGRLLQAQPGWREHHDARHHGAKQGCPGYNLCGFRYRNRAGTDHARVGRGLRNTQSKPHK
jgi:hypothetical protein